MRIAKARESPDIDTQQTVRPGIKIHRRERTGDCPGSRDMKISISSKGVVVDTKSASHNLLVYAGSTIIGGIVAEHVHATTLMEYPVRDERRLRKADARMGRRIDLRHIIRNAVVLRAGREPEGTEIWCRQPKSGSESDTRCVIPPCHKGEIVR